MAKFTKSEMLEELTEIIFQHARSSSFVMAPEDGYRLLFGKNPETPEDLHFFMNPRVIASEFGNQISIEKYQATRSVEQFYDYGLLGIKNISAVDSGGANEWTFAYGLIRDSVDSVLLRESMNGDSVDGRKCLHAAKAFFARLILDGGDRTIIEHSSGPIDMLSIAEVAILADLDERTVRNATSKNAPNRLETAVVDSNIYIPRESALAWLETKRGFIPTRVGQELLSGEILKDAFSSAAEAGAFIQDIRLKNSFNEKDLAAKTGEKLNVNDIRSLENGTLFDNEELLVALGSALKLNGELFSLRILEVIKKEEMRTIHRRISSTL